MKKNNQKTLKLLLGLLGLYSTNLFSMESLEDGSHVISKNIDVNPSSIIGTKDLHAIENQFATTPATKLLSYAAIVALKPIKQKNKIIKYISEAPPSITSAPILMPTGMPYDYDTTTLWFIDYMAAINKQNERRKSKGRDFIHQELTQIALAHKIPWIVENYINTYAVMQKISPTEIHAFIPGALYTKDFAPFVGLFEISWNPKEKIIFHRGICKYNPKENVTCDGDIIKDVPKIINQTIKDNKSTWNKNKMNTRFINSVQEAHLAGDPTQKLFTYYVSEKRAENNDILAIRIRDVEEPDVTYELQVGYKHVAHE